MCSGSAAAELSFYHHQVLSTEDGLPQASVHALLEGRDGYLWIGTEGGVARFDGHGFRVFDHTTSPCFTQDDVSSLADDDAGNLWVATSDGVIALQGDVCTRYTSQQGLPSNDVLSLAPDGKGVAVLTAGGMVSQLTDHSLASLLQSRTTSITASLGGTVLLSLQDGNLLQYGERGIALVAGETGDFAPPLGIVSGPRGELWFFDQGAVHVGMGRGGRSWRVGADLPGSRIQTLYLEPDGTAWVGTNHGLAWIEVAGARRSHVVSELQRESILSVLRDREGDLWVGTEASGLHVFQPRRFAAEPRSQQQLVSTVVRGDDGAMYLGTKTDGVLRAQHGGEAVAAGQLTSPVILSLAAGVRGDLWVGTPDGLNQVTRRGVRRWTIANGLPDNFVRAIQVDRNGTVWAGTRFGLARVDREQVRTFSRADGLPRESIGALAETRSLKDHSTILWVGTAAGLCRLEGVHFACITQPQAALSAVTSLAPDAEGRLLVAVHGQGLAFAEGDRLNFLHSNAIPQEIVGVLVDGRDFVWLRSERGLFRIRLADAKACSELPSRCAGLKVDRYDRADGMPSDELTMSASPVLATSATGQLWIATRRGVAITDAGHLKTARVPPGLVITSARADEVEFPMDGTAKLSPDHRQYSITYVGLSLNHAARTRYEYRLDGLDRDWVQAGTRATAFFTKLPPRSYVFRVRCVNGEGVWSQVTALHFIVLKPWYRRWWAYMLAGLVIVAAILTLVRGRVLAERRRLTLVLQERSRVAREVHDTLAQDLVSVSLQLEMTSQHAKAGQLQETTQGLAQAKGLVRQALSSARQSIWDLRANLSQSSLPARLTARADQTREKGIVVRLHIGGEYRETPENISMEVLRVASEALSNVERHSGATEVSVDLVYATSALRLTIKDNGCGFDLTELRGRPGHYGLRGLEERTSVLGGELCLRSEPGEGTTLKLDAPLGRPKR